MLAIFQSSDGASYDMVASQSVYLDKSGLDSLQGQSRAGPRVRSNHHGGRSNMPRE